MILIRQGLSYIRNIDGDDDDDEYEPVWPDNQG
jgi:hypothetical protein